MVLHDAGKAIHTAELSGPGSEHEPTGEKVLLERGVPATLARVCRSHAQWATLETSLEELVVALADKLWKGARVPALEGRVIDAAATLARRDRWDLFVPLDAVFEEVAGGGEDRLSRSRV